MTTDNGPLTPDQGPLSADDRHCRFLRCKEMFIETGREFKMSESGSGIFWCAHTQNCLGPDGQVVGLADCQPGRICHEPV